MRIVSTPRNDTTRSLGLDTVQYLTPFAPMILGLGIRAVLRYIRRDPVVRDAPDTSDDWLKSLSHQELEELTACGLDVGLVQIGSRSAPSTAAHGRQIGEAAGANARALCERAAVLRSDSDRVITICDCEWTVAPDTISIAAYLESWADGCVRASDGWAEPWLYVTPDLSGLGPAGLYRLPFRGYMYSATWHAGVAVRGPGIVQSGPFMISSGTMRPVGVSERPGPGELLCDLDLFRWDHLGGRPSLLAA